MYLPQLQWRPRWFIDDTVLRREGSRSQGRKLTLQALELGTNNFSVTLVACLGFFTGSYVLFTSTNILPMLAFIYWRDATKSYHETAFNNATTGGCIFGMLFFGFCADRFGRRTMYGFELIVLMIGTMGVVMSSSGFIPIDQVQGRVSQDLDFGSVGSMDIQKWLLFWRFITGVGIGGEYPLSAVIAAEFAPSSSRSRMLATVFSMQSVGISIGALVSWAVTRVVEVRHPYDSLHPDVAARHVDQVWRWVVGSGLVPAVIAAIMRFTIPESPRFSLDVRDNPAKACEEAMLLKEPLSGVSYTDHESSGNSSQDNGESDEDEDDGTLNAERQHDESAQEPTLKQYFWIRGNWRQLFATCAAWFFLDFALFALGLNSTQTLSRFWNGPTVMVKSPKTWNSNLMDANASIYSVLTSNSVHLLVIVGIPALAGSLLIILFISRLNRKLLLWVMFLVIGLLLIIDGVTLLETKGTSTWGINIALYALIQFAQQFSVAPMTFIIPAEIFPTKYRASCHGLSAALGKVGSVLAAIFLQYVAFGKGSSKITSSRSPSEWLGYVLIIFAIPMLLGALVSFIWIPDLQDASGHSKTLEQLAEGRNKNEASSSEQDQV